MAWEALALMAAFISVMVAALLIMLSRFFDFKALEQSGKSELVFAASTVFVVIFIIGLVHFGTDAGKKIAFEMYQYTYQNSEYLHYKVTDANGNTLDYILDDDEFNNPDYSLIEISILYMRGVMYCTENIGLLAYWVSMPAHWMSSISQDVFMAYPMGGWAWGGVAQAADNLLNTVYFMELIYRLIVYVLRFADVFTLPFLLPAGIFLRSFPPTRGAGAYVISFSLGIYLVFPLSYLAAVFASPYPPVCATPDIPAPILEGNSQGGLIHNLTLWYMAFEEDIISMMGRLSELSSALMANLCLMPFLALTLTLTFTQFGNGLFGANVPEIGRGLIKLI